VVKEEQSDIYIGMSQVDRSLQVVFHVVRRGDLGRSLLRRNRDRRGIDRIYGVSTNTHR